MVVPSGQKIKPGIEVTTNIGCNVGCWYCPQQRLVRAYSLYATSRIMLLGSFANYLDLVPTDVELFFSGFSEPWLNNDCTQMVLYAHRKGFGVNVFTVGSFIRSSDISVLENVPFRKFVVHITKGAIKRCGIEWYLRLIGAMAMSNITGLKFITLNDQSQRDFIKPIALLLEDCGRILETWKLHSRAENLPEIGERKKKSPTVQVAKCKRSRRGVLLPNGLVTLCCMDWGLEHVIGRLGESDYHGIYGSEKFNAILDAGKDADEDLLCKKCEQAPR